MRARIGTKGDPKNVWQISLASSGSETKEAKTPPISLTGELTIGPTAAGLKLDGAPYLQNAENPVAAEEPAQLPGLLTAVLQLRKLLSGEKAAFNEQLAMGQTLHLPLQKSVHILVTREGARTSRWYFTSESPFPVGVDVEYGQGIDEARLVFENWQESENAVFPARIGIVAGVQEQLIWLTMGEVKVKQ
jgi:hypothetical protein